MNKEIEQFTRGLVLEKLTLVTDEQFMVFKRMYSHKDLEAIRETVSNKMDINKTEHALLQLDNQILKNKNNGTQS